MRLNTCIPSACVLLFVTVLGPAAWAQVTPADVVVIESAELDGYNAGRARQDEFGRPEYDKQQGAGVEHAYGSVCGDTALIGFTGSYDKVLPSGYDLNPGINGLQAMVVAGRLTGQEFVLGEPRSAFPLLDGSDEQRDGLKPIVECLDASRRLWAMSVNSPKNNPRGDDESRNWVAVFGVQDDVNGHPVPVQLTTEVPFMGNNNDNCADTDYGNLRSRTVATGQYQLNFVGSCNGNGDDDAWHTKFSITCDLSNNCVVSTAYDPDSEYSYKTKYETGIERNRPVMFRLSSTRLLVIGTDGNHQPPKSGIKASVLDADSLDPISNVTIAPREDDGGFLNTMAHAAQLTATDFLVSYQTRDRIMGDEKGPALLMMGKLRATPDGQVQWLKAPKGRMFEGAPATHHTMCEVPEFGDVTSGTMPAAILLTTSTQGGSAAQVRIITSDPTTHDIEHRMTVILPVRHDNMMVSHYYGNNPGFQGKNSQYCTTIENPGFNNPATAYPDVKSFLLFPAATRREASDGSVSEKLALDVGLVPMAFNGTTPAATIVTGVDPEIAFQSTGIIPGDGGGSGRGIESSRPQGTTPTGPYEPPDPSEFDSAAGYPFKSGGCRDVQSNDSWVVACILLWLIACRRRRK